MPDPAAEVRSCPVFELKDQHGRMHSFRFPRAKVTVLVIADRKGSEQIDGWVRPLQAEFGDGIDIAGLADVRRVPFFMRGLIRGSFRKSVEHPVMLDWTGEIVSRFEFEEEEANLYLIDREGRIRSRVSGSADQLRLRQVALAVREMDANATSANGRAVRGSTD